jgi:hypothetical protein
MAEDRSVNKPSVTVSTGEYAHDDLAAGHFHRTLSRPEQSN